MMIMKKNERRDEISQNSTLNSTQSIVKLRRAQSNVSKTQNKSKSRLDSFNQDIDIELSHVNNLDIWKINTQKQLRDQNKIEKQKLVYSSTLIEKTEPQIKMEIINNIMQNDKSNNTSFMNYTRSDNNKNNYSNNNNNYSNYNNNNSNYNNNNSNYNNNNSNNNSNVNKSQTTINHSRISSMFNLQSSNNLSRRNSTFSSASLVNPQATVNQQFFKNDKNKVVISKIVLNKLQSIYNQEKTIDQQRVLQERPKIDNTLKNFKNLGMTLSSSAIDIQEIQQQIISIQSQPKKLFDFSEEMRRIETEKLDFVNCERKILQKMYQLQYNIKVLRDCKKQIRAHIYDLSNKLSLFNLKIIMNKYERLEKSLVLGYFQERKKGDSSKFNIRQIKEKLKFDDVFIGYLEKLKEMKQKEIDEYNDAKQQISSIAIILQQQFEFLKTSSQEIKENYVKCKMQLRDMFVDLFTTHLKTFLSSSNLSWIVRGYITIDEQVPIQKLPRCLDDNSIEYALQSGQIFYDIQLLEEKKPQIFTKYNQESENVNQVLKELADRLNAIPLLNQNTHSQQEIPLNGSDSPSNQNGKLSFLIPELDDEMLNEDVISGSQSEISSNKINGVIYQHYAQLKMATSIQTMFSNQTQNIFSTDTRIIAEEEQSQQAKYDFNPTIDKRLKDLKSQLQVLKRKEISRLIELINTKQIKEETFTETISILFGYNEKDRVLREFFQKKQRNEYIEQEKQMQNPLYQKQQQMLQRKKNQLEDYTPTSSTKNNNNNINTISTKGQNMFQRSLSIPTIKQSINTSNAYKRKAEITLNKQSNDMISISNYNFLNQKLKYLNQIKHNN